MPAVAPPITSLGLADAAPVPRDASGTTREVRSSQDRWIPNGGSTRPGHLRDQDRQVGPRPSTFAYVYPCPVALLSSAECVSRMRSSAHVPMPGAPSLQTRGYPPDPE